MARTKLDKQELDLKDESTHLDVNMIKVLKNMYNSYLWIIKLDLLFTMRIIFAAIIIIVSLVDVDLRDTVFYLIQILRKG
jgi:hypothetical protein